MIALRQTVFFFCLFTAMVWAGLPFYHQAASDSRRATAEKLCHQALFSQDVSSTSFLNLLAASFAEFSGNFSGSPALADDQAFFEELRDGVLLSNVTANTAVLGVLKGKRGRAGAMLVYRTEGAVGRLALPLDFDGLVERSSAQKAWAGPICGLPPEAAQGHAGMLLAKTMNPEGDWLGLVITMPWIIKTINDITGLQKVSTAYITDQGEYIIYPPGRSVSQGPQGLAEEFMANPAEMKRFLASIKNRETGIMPLEKLFPGDSSPWALPWEGPASIAYAPMSIEGWSFMMLVSSEEIGATEPSPPLSMVLAALLSPILAAFLAWKISSRVIQPLSRLSGALGRIADGDLETPLPAPETRDEISDMLRAFEQVRVTLKHSFANLAEATAAEQRLRNELALARAIQESMLPVSPPDIPGLSVATAIDMAGEVCGDLFDCFALPDEPDVLYCLIGDVCGKGIPASVVMSRAMVLARSFLLSGAGCGQTLARLNAALLRSSDSLMFVTMLIARLDGKSGLFTWAAAGHPPPLPGPSPLAGTGPVPWSRELVLGVQPDITYTEHSFTLARGQYALLYTDGADEAMGPNSSAASPGESEGREVFGEERLAAAFMAACEKTAPADVLQSLRASLLSHMGGAPPFDDVSLIVIRRD
jgi:serine phosphatase RsbU (regulator of sigma subunit)